MCSTFTLPAPPQVLYQAPPGAQQLTRPDFLNKPHLGHAIDLAIDSSGDGILFVTPSRSDIEQLLGEMDSESFPIDRQILLTDIAQNEDLFQEANLPAHRLAQIWGAGPTQPNTETSAYQMFQTAYGERFETAPGPFTPHAYDAAWLTIYGALWAHYQDSPLSGIGIARGMRLIDRGSEIAVGPSSWSTAKSEFESGSQLDVQGASGELNYDATTGELLNPIAIWQVVEDGTAVSIEEIDVFEF